jgi:hypothetical protein
VALGYKYDITISITARDVDIEDVSLVTIRDVEPYIEGSQATARTPERSVERMKARRSLQGCADPSVALTNGIERNEPPADRAPARVSAAEPGAG